MKIFAPMLVAGSITLLAAADLVPNFPSGFGLIGKAHAVVGAPMTPMSAAGVARRTAVRTTAAVSSSAAAQQSAAKPPAPAPAAAPAPAPSAGAPPAVGTVVASLPKGCVSAPVGGAEYQLCNGVYYRAAFQGNNLVYVVQKP
jgi:hypothetical protein